MKTYLELEEVERMEQTAACVRDKLLIRLLFHLGCRISEALAIKVKDIDFSQGMLTILHLKSRLKLSCPHCQARLGKSHRFCPRCGTEVNEPMARTQESQRRRTLFLDVNIGTTMRYRKVAGKELKDWYSRLWEGRDNG